VLCHCVLVTPDDTVVFIPHAKLWNTKVFNGSAGRRDLLLGGLSSTDGLHTRLCADVDIPAWVCSHGSAFTLTPNPSRGGPENYGS
jgi:hypothetical protein